MENLDILIEAKYEHINFWKKLPACFGEVSGKSSHAWSALERKHLVRFEWGEYRKNLCVYILLNDPRDIVKARKNGT